MRKCPRRTEQGRSGDVVAMGFGGPGRLSERRLAPRARGNRKNPRRAGKDCSRSGGVLVRKPGGLRQPGGSGVVVGAGCLCGTRGARAYGP